MGEFKFEPIRVNSTAPGSASVLRTFDDIGAFILLNVDIPQRQTRHWQGKPSDRISCKPVSGPEGRRSMLLCETRSRRKAVLRIRITRYAGFFLRCAMPFDLGCRRRWKTECGRGDRHCEVVQRDKGVWIYSTDNGGKDVFAHLGRGKSWSKRPQRGCQG